MITYLARTRVPGPDHRGKDASYQGVVDYAADRYGLRVEHLVVADNFLPEVGFLRRDNFRRSYVSRRFSPRPQSIESVRQFSLEGSVDYIVTADQNHLETRQNLVTFQTELESSDRLLFTASDNYELLVRPFTLPGAGFSIPVGGYGFADAQVAYVIGQQRRINGQVAVRRGAYFDGDLTTVELSQGRIAVLPQMSVEPTVSFGSNLRLRWEYSPGSELFVVYTDDRDVTGGLRPDRGWDLRNRGFVVKFNRLFRF